MPTLDSSMTIRLQFGAAAFALASFFSPSTFAADAADFDKLKAGLQNMQSETKKLTYSQKTWEKKGKEESSFRADCWWMGQTTIRMDIIEGNGKGGVAVLKNGKVTGFLKGILSFAKLTYDPKDKAVLGLRGAGMPAAGFMDDVKIILSQWDNGKVTFNDDKAVIDYTGPDKFPMKMWVKSDGTLVVKTETYENGAMVMRSEYGRVNYAAAFDPAKIFDP
jgi:hypothetical protein